jgi:Leucine-rich repeat (LRR) protein
MYSLLELKLNDSIIKSARDLGTSFTNVRILHISRCEMTELSGILALDKLEELYASHNFID